MSLRWHPQTLDEKIAAIEEFIRRWELGNPVAAQIIAAVQSAEHTLIFHIPSTVAVGVYEAIVPLFGAQIVGIRANCTTAPAGGPVEFNFRINGVAVSTLPATILDTLTLGETQVPDVTPSWIADDVLDIEVIAINGATGLVISIDHTRA